MRTLSKHFAACLALCLVGCAETGMKNYSLDKSHTADALANGETDPQSLLRLRGRDLGEAEAQKLDSQLATAMTMKREIEVTGRSIKQGHAANTDAQREGEYKYNMATSALDALRVQVRNDFVNKVDEPSAATLQASATLQQRGNELIAYHGTLTGNRSSALVSVVLGFMGDLYRAWAGFQGEKQAAVLAGVDQRLSPVGWQSL